MKQLKRILVMMLMVVMLCGSTRTVFAEEGDSPEYVSDEWKDQIRGQLNRYYSDLKLRYDLTEEKIKRMDKIYNSAMTYMKNAGLTMSELTSYEREIEWYLG